MPFLKTLSVVLLTVACLLTAACGQRTERREVSRSVVDHEYIAGHSEVVTEYKYVPNLFGEETFKLMPEVKTVHVDPEYRLQYCITYDDGTTETRWESVTKAEYTEARIDD